MSGEGTGVSAPLPGTVGDAAIRAPAIYGEVGKAGFTRDMVHQGNYIYNQIDNIENAEALTNKLIEIRNRPPAELPSQLVKSYQDAADVVDKLIDLMPENPAKEVIRVRTH